MAARFLLDTDICIFIRRRHLPHLQARFDKLADGEAVMSLVTYGELRYGAEKHVNRVAALKTIEELATLITVLPMGPEVSEHYAVLRAELEKSGTVIGNNDLWIAAHALAEGLILVTNNEREFRRVPKLRVQNWAAPA